MIRECVKNYFLRTCPQTGEGGVKPCPQKNLKKNGLWNKLCFPAPHCPTSPTPLNVICTFFYTIRFKPDGPFMCQWQKVFFTPSLRFVLTNQKVTLFIFNHRTHRLFISPYFIFNTVSFVLEKNAKNDLSRNMAEYWIFWGTGGLMENL